MTEEKKIYTYEEAMKSSLEYFDGDDLAAKVFLDKYALRDREDNILEDNPTKMHWRLAKEFARMEKKYPNPMSEEEIFNLFDHFLNIIPQGSPMSAIGNPYHIQSSGNCFSIDSPYDSYGGIFYTDQQLAQLMKRRCGCGVEISTLRPKGMPVKNSAKTTDGISVFMERYSNTCREVAQGGRRGAEILILSVHHPEIKTFINIKRDKQKVTGANISIRATDEFIKAVKNNDEFELRWPVKGDPLISQKVSAKEVWDEFISSSWESAEPGILFWDTVIKNSVSNCYGIIDKAFYDIACNPCVTGETLVYVADGRGDVPIKDLAKDGKDVPVFCYDKKGKTTIRKMRNPRITGYGKKIYKVTIEGGHSIRVTQNHKFRMVNGEYKKVSNINPGESIKILTKFEASLKDIFKDCNSNSQDYLWIKDGTSCNVAEHRVIASYYYGRQLKKGEVVHHNDRDSKNNSSLNLEIMTKKEHDLLHAKEMHGENNPYYKMDDEWKYNFASHPGEKNSKYSGFTHDDIRKAAISLTKKIGRKFTYKEWNNYAIEKSLPRTFSSWRKKEIGSISNLSSWAAKKCGFEEVKQSFANIKTYKKAIEEGYNVFIMDGKVYIKRYCEFCKKEYSVLYKQREISYCSQICGAAGYSLDKSIDNKYNQLLCFTNLKYRFGKEPLKKEWEEECKKNNVPFRLKTKNGFDSYSTVKKEAEFFNHKILKIEEDGYEDVYNGTVDEFHNFFVGGFKSKTKNNKCKTIYINNLQCGEIVQGKDSCRLIAIPLYYFVNNKFKYNAEFDYERFADVAQKAQRLMDDMVDLEIELIQKIISKIDSDPEPEYIKTIEKETWEGLLEICKKGRRTGLGITGLGDTLAALGVRYGSRKSIKITEEIYKTLCLNAYRSTCTLAEERGAFPIFSHKVEKNNNFLNKVWEEDIDLYKKYKQYGRRNIALTTTPPAGSISILSQTTSGIEPAFMLKYKRRKKINPSDQNSRIDFVDNVGDSWQEFDIYHHGFKKWMEITGKTNIEDSPYYKSTSNDIDWKASVDIQAVAQKWVCHAISKTCNLPKDTSKELISEIFMRAYEKGCKGFTIYRDGSRSGVLVSEQEKKDNITKTKSPKRPKEMQGDLHQVSVKGNKYFVLVGILNGLEPYEVFAGHGDIERLPKQVIIKKIKRNTYCILDDSSKEVLLDDISKKITDEEESLTRMISLGLRHGADINFVTHQLEKTSGDLLGFSKAISRVLKKYIAEGSAVHGESCPECGSSLHRMEGCISCTCGFSKCG
jgi:ribonucleotide reductase alpha subunit